MHPAASAAAAPDLSERQKRHLRGLAHALKPVIRIGNPGLTDAVVRETARALQDHELIKVKAPGAIAARAMPWSTQLAQQTAQRPRAPHRQRRGALPPARRACRAS